MNLNKNKNITFLVLIKLTFSEKCICVYMLKLNILF